MPLTNLELLRLRAADPYRPFQEQQQGDGSAIIYQLSSYPVRPASETLYIDGASQSDPAEYGLEDDLGRVTWVSAPGAGTAVLAVGEASIFSDTQLNDILTRAGLTPGADAGNILAPLLEVLEILMMNQAMRDKWSAGDLMIDPTKTVANLDKLYERLKVERDRGVIDEGGVEEWAIEQAFYR